MSKEQRANAIAVAKYVGGHLPNGPTAGDFQRAAVGENEDVLKAIHLILMNHENAKAQADVIG